MRASQRRRRLVDAALNQGEIRAWDFQPFRDARRQYIRNSMDLDDLEAMAQISPAGPPTELDRRNRADCGECAMLAACSNRDLPEIGA